MQQKNSLASQSSIRTSIQGTSIISPRFEKVFNINVNLNNSLVQPKKRQLIYDEKKAILESKTSQNSNKHIRKSIPYSVKDINQFSGFHSQPNTISPSYRERQFSPGNPLTNKKRKLLHNLGKAVP